MLTNVNQQVVLVFGKLCSGKGTYSKTLVQQDPRFIHVTTSDIVKHLVNTTSRALLQLTGHLDAVIAEKMVNLITTTPYIVIDGIRQVSIIDVIEQNFTNIQYIWVETDAATRKHRFTDRNDKKDETLNFEHCERGDAQLGLDQVEKYIKSLPNVVIVNG